MIALIQIGLLNPTINDIVESQRLLPDVNKRIPSDAVAVIISKNSRRRQYEGSESRVPSKSRMLLHPSSSRIQEKTIIQNKNVLMMPMTAVVASRLSCEQPPIASR
jgi:hypothetical protein